MVRAGLGLLLLANLVAAAVVFKPWASSLEDLEQQAASLRQQVRQRQLAVERTRTIVNKVESARKDGDQFMATYLVGERSMASSLAQELDRSASQAGIRRKDMALSDEAVEGSDTLTKATITAAYEGTYADLIHFLNLLDRSKRFLIVESLGAAPQQSGTLLSVTIKMSTFVREGGEVPEEAADTPQQAAPQTPVTPSRQVQNIVPTMPPPSAPPAGMAPGQPAPVGARGFSSMPRRPLRGGNRSQQ